MIAKANVERREHGMDRAAATGVGWGGVGWGVGGMAGALCEILIENQAGCPP